MSEVSDIIKSNDEVLMNILLKNKTLVGFLFSVFGFLSRKTDFYVIRDEKDADSGGFPPGIAEELVLRVLRKCNAISHQNPPVPETCHELIDDSECIPPPVAQEVEIEATDDSESNIQTTELENLKITDQTLANTHKDLPKDASLNSPGTSETEMQGKTTPPLLIEYQTHPESFNGAKRDHYNWSQSIGELDVTVKLPKDVTTSKQLKVDLTSDTMTVKYLSSSKEWTILLHDKLANKIKAAETIWTMSEGKVRIQIEKQTECWWNSLLESEEKIDTSKIDCSRPLHELPEDHIAKVRELQWNQIQKMSGKPTSDDIKKEDILRKAWDMPGSPFANTPYDPNVFH